MASLVNHLVVALRQKPMRFGYVLAVLVVSVVLFTYPDVLPAPYDFSR